MDHLHECFQRSYRRLVGQLYTVCGDVVEAEEVVAEAFVRAAANPRRFERVDNPEAWLRTVAVNVARSRHRRQKLAERLRGQQVAEQHHPELGSRDLDLINAVRQLPSSQREAIALHYLADLPITEVAETLGVAIGTVKARLSRGRKALASIIDPAAGDVEEAHHV